jgi:hypothetical protein
MHAAAIRPACGQDFVAGDRQEPVEIVAHREVNDLERAQ